MNLRALAARTLASVIQQKNSLDRSVQSQLTKLASKDIPLYREMCFGVARHFYSLDFISAQLLNKPLKNKDADVQALILLGLYQVLHMRVPDHAAINETVSAVKALKKPWATRLVNGVLRRFLREREALVARTEKANAVYDHPPWLIQRIRKAWPEQWQDILKANNLRAPFTLRVNQQRTTRERFCHQLEAQEIGFRLAASSEHAVILNKAVDVTEIPQFLAGECSVQDEAAQLCAELMQLSPGLRVLDACCAPGGKTCHMAEVEPKLKQLVGIDLEEGRLERVRENLTRLHLDARLIACDALELDSWWQGEPFDRILLDAPCSATGVIRRHPDIKLLRRDEDIASLSALQFALLRRMWQTLKPGGLLLYATCSVLPEENEKVVSSFVKSQADAIHLPIEADWGVERDVGRQLFPTADGHDGFYYARLEKAQ